MRYKISADFFGLARGWDKNDPLPRIWGLSILAIIAGYAYLIYAGQFGAAFIVTTKTLPLYFVFSIVMIFGVVCWWKDENFLGSELSVYAVIAFFAIFIACALGFLWLTDLKDVEVWNGRAEKAEWTERYYTESKDSDGKVTDTDYGPYYKVYTTADEVVDMTEGEWRNYVSHWGGQGRVVQRRNLQADGARTGYGTDGDFIPEIHTITWDNKAETVVPTSVEHIYANYVKGSENVFKVKGVKDGYARFLLPYPRVTEGPLGTIYFNRVVDAGVNLGSDFSSKLDSTLDLALMNLGKQRQCNVVVYVVGTADVGFFSALQEHWNLGKKNDICVIIGCEDSSVSWCKVMSYTDRKLFLEKLEQRVRDFGPLNGKGEELANLIVSQITAPGDEGYLRKPMADYAYLAAQVRMPFWVQILATLAAAVLVMPTVLMAIRD